MASIAKGLEPPRWIGDPTLLEGGTIGLLASIRVPPDLVLPALDLVIELGRRGVTLASGFQTPLERTAFDLLLRRDRRLILALPRTLRRFRVPAGWKKGIEEGRLLLLSATEERRATRETAEARNHLLATIADTLLVVHATPGGRAWRTTSTALARGMTVMCIAHPANLDLEVLGATPIRGAREIPSSDR